MKYLLLSVVFGVFAFSAVHGEQASLDTFPDYIEKCSQKTDHPSDYYMQQMASGDTYVREDDACVYLCALREAQWVNENGQMSAETVQRLADENPRLASRIRASQPRVDQINGANMTPCARAYEFAKFGYNMYSYSRRQ